ncbi:MAG: hypothetical protein DRN68_08920 [Thaumarchaeota archaeon]|nr:MAG: hypothetical protein DRN68_08920 [Nitrososphaerota archaeon]
MVRLRGISEEGMARVDGILIQVLCHATEDEEKVMRAVENIIGSEAMENASITSQSLTGYYGDPILFIRLKIDDSKIAGSVLARILSNLSKYDLQDVLRERSKIGKHGGKIYFRFDKQAAYLGSFRIMDKDPIRIQVNIRGKVERLLEKLMGGRA